MPELSVSRGRRLKSAIRVWQQRMHVLLGTVSSAELLFQAMFNHAVADLRDDTTFYPVGSAANYSLLYIVDRVLKETNVASALDIGAGQTTVLFDRLRGRLERPLTVSTIESDPGWAERVQAKVRHRIKRADLIHRDVQGYSCRTYAEWPDGTFDFVVVDGPKREKQRSRWGVLDVLEKQLDEDFVVVFDDATRAGELDTIDAFLRMNQHIAGCRFIHGSKSQCVVYSAKYRWLENFY